MKFSNGCWLQKEGIECFSPKEAYFTCVEDTSVTICAPTMKINHRGDTLGGVNLTIVITSPMPEVLRVQTWHHRGVLAKSPEFDLKKKEALPLQVTETESDITITSGTLSLIITKDNWSMDIEEPVSSCNFIKSS